MENSSGSSLEQTLQDGKLHRQLNSLIVAHLRDNNLNQAASAVASATMTPLNVEAPPNRLLELFAKGLAAEKDDMLKGVSSTAMYDLGTTLVPTVYGSIPASRAASVDFSDEGKVGKVLKVEPLPDCFGHFFNLINLLSL